MLNQYTRTSTTKPCMVMNTFLHVQLGWRPGDIMDDDDLARLRRKRHSSEPPPQKRRDETEEYRATGGETIERLSYLFDKRCSNNPTATTAWSPLGQQSPKPCTIPKKTLTSDNLPTYGCYRQISKFSQCSTLDTLPSLQGHQHVTSTLDTLPSIDRADTIDSLPAMEWTVQQNMPEVSTRKRGSCHDPVSWADGKVQTVMVRNLPRQYTQWMLLEDLNARGFDGVVDFIYVPFDLRKRANVGYSFINFAGPSFASSFKHEFEGMTLGTAQGKPLHIHPASVQGYDALREHFNQSTTGAKNDPQYAPWFKPIDLRSKKAFTPGVCKFASTSALTV
eukprot:gnl/TRDRNA2_/TRDRNA2_126830_c0_seq2.p1 gnl/TRDRNA2_/TRDRNA2_126830_c0~~gnl/TRDRNA2_/TRDRNA2_126830_c0_seq2.p1  ORF type:complete len:335 (+),score=46.56 gnl/TRDRNA2_/TRDRNA2_126830_c0_seq2:122-1126(+)